MSEKKNNSSKLPQIVFADPPKKKTGGGGHLPKSKITFPLILIGLFVVLVGSVFLYKNAIRTGAKALADSYNSAFATEREAAYETLYQKFYDDAESNYHVSNRETIQLGELREVADLEVLKVSDVEYIIDESSDNGKGITAWLEVPGNGIYIVNLKAAEFIVDGQRSYVLVRAPYPQLTNVTIDYSNVNKLLFKNDVFNESYKYGEEQAERMLNSADSKIMKEFMANEHFFLSAQNAAKSSITCLVKQLNPENQDLVVEVEFY